SSTRRSRASKTASSTTRIFSMPESFSAPASRRSPAARFAMRANAGSTRWSQGSTHSPRVSASGSRREPGGSGSGRDLDNTGPRSPYGRLWRRYLRPLALFKQRDEQTDRHQGAAQAFADVQPQKGEPPRAGQESEGPECAARRDAVQRGRLREAHGLRVERHGRAPRSRTDGPENRRRQRRGRQSALSDAPASVHR